MIPVLFGSTSKLLKREILSPKWPALPMKNDNDARKPDTLTFNLFIGVIKVHTHGGYQ